MPPAPGSLPYNTLLEQLNSSNEELQMRKEEVLLLQSHMVRQDAIKRKVRLSGLSSSPSAKIHNRRFCPLCRRWAD